MKTSLFFLYIYYKIKCIRNMRILAVALAGTELTEKINERDNTFVLKAFSRPTIFRELDMKWNQENDFCLNRVGIILL